MQPKNPDEDGQRVGRLVPLIATASELREARFVIPEVGAGVRFGNRSPVASGA
jgi:hypothetical protein